MQPPAKGRESARGTRARQHDRSAQHDALCDESRDRADCRWCDRASVTSRSSPSTITLPPLGNRTQWEVVGDKRGEPSSIGGHYEDLYAKTPKGWRFKRRHFIPSKSGGGTSTALATLLKSPVAINSQPADNVTAANGSLSVMDYPQIRAAHRELRACARFRLRKGR